VPLKNVILSNEEATRLQMARGANEKQHHAQIWKVFGGHFSRYAVFGTFRGDSVTFRPCSHAQKGNL
jgi:hypothetical protein